MFLSFLLFPVGIAMLVKGADWLVDGASSIAKKLGVSALVIGLTIVAFGTSAPELIVNVIASLNGSTDIAIGNILGSNIANIFLILGIAAMIYPLTVQKGTVWKEIPFSMLAVLTLGLMVSDASDGGQLFVGLTRNDGMILILFFIIFLYYTFGISKATGDDGGEKITLLSTPRSILMIAGGLAGLTLGGKFVVDSAVMIAKSFGLSEALIGLTIVALGTSLPELVTSAIAARKKNADIAIGNVVGSNIFNIFWILGLSAVISPLPFSQVLMRDVYMAIFATFLLFLHVSRQATPFRKMARGRLCPSIYRLYRSLSSWGIG